jgi:uncharacterized membrane protein
MDQFTSNRRGSGGSHRTAYDDTDSRYRQFDMPYEPEANGTKHNMSLATALGWFSIGLGVAQLLAPAAVSRAVGMGERPLLMRTIGAREIASGAGILAQRKPTTALWSRVAGDAMDLATLAVAARSPRASNNRLMIAAAAVAGVAILDMLSSIEHTKRPTDGLDSEWSDDVHVEKVITVNRSSEECYQFWREFDNFPRFMKHLESVEQIDDKTSRWKAKAPAGARMEWEAQITEDKPGELLAWRSLEGADIDNAGVVRFERAPGGRGTIVRVQLHYSPPGGKAGKMIAKLFGEEPAQQIDDDLRRFKWLIETGEIPTIAGQSSGQRSMFVRLLRQGEPG